MWLKIGSRLLALGLCLAGTGAGFAPWIWHDSIALQLTAPGLAEFVKFLPEVRTGQVEVERLFFLCPLFLVMLLLPVLMANPALVLPQGLRWSLRLAVVPLALVSLSPVWTPAILMSSEFRWQTSLTLLSLSLVLLASFFKRLPLKFLIITFIGGNLASAVLASWQFNLVQAAIADVYQEPIRLGWGWWLMITGMLMGSLGGLVILFASRRR
jgi:hypothetical protein